MFKNIVPLVLALFVSCSLWAQTPREIVVTPTTSGSRSSMMCADQDAGNISFAGAGPDNQSNDVRTLNAVDPIFLCWGDEFTVQHDQASANFVGGDPTRRGVGYAFYVCRPRVSGITLGDILGDTCTLRSLTDDTKPLVFVAGKTTGSSTFRNENNAGSLSLQQLFNNGDPVQYWFTPITYDNFNNNDEAIYEDGDNSCVNSDTSQAFSVVYLNPINFTVSASDCGGELLITGGLPEFTNSNYTVEIVNTVDNTITGTISGLARHDETAIFTVPSAGEYIVSIRDNKACTTTERSIDVTICDPTAALNLELPCPGDIIEGDRVCLDFQVSNFNNIVAMEIPLEWNPMILEFESSSVDQTIIDAIKFDNSFISATEPGKLKVAAWITDDFTNGSTLPDGSILFTACFIANAQGNPNFTITDDPDNFSPLEIIGAFDGEIAFSSTLCTDPNDFNVAPRPPDGEIIVQPEITAPCQGQDNGKLFFSFVGGMAPYNLDLRGTSGYDESFTIFGQDTIIEALAVGDYSYFIIDEGNTAQAISPISDPIGIREVVLNVDFEEAAPNCIGENSGRLTAIPLIFNTPASDPDQFTYTWSTSSNDTLQILDSLIAGQYEVTITNANGCTGIDDERLPDAEPLIIDNIISTPAQCSGTFDGSLRAVLTDGTDGEGTLNYEWNIDPTINSANIPNLDVGDYNLIVTDANGCTVTEDSRVSGAIEISVDSIVTDVQCFNAGNGTINISPVINVSVSVANYNYIWSPNTTSVESGGPQSIASDLSPGTYEVMITNSDIDAQCFGTATFEITEPDSLMLAIDITNVTRCQLNIPDGSATVAATGGNDGVYAYVWSEIGNGISNDDTAMRLDADSITVSVADSKGCITELDTIIGSPAPPQIVTFDNDDISCADGRGSLQVVAGPGDARVADTYIWEGPNNVASNLSVAGNLAVGTYFVTVSDDNDCISIDSAEVTAPPAFDYNSFVVDREPCFGDTNGEFSLEVTGGTPGYDFVWEFEGEEISTNNNTITDAAAGNYRLRGTDLNNCDIDTTITLASLPEIVVVFSNPVPTSCALSETPDGGATATATYAGGMLGEFDFIWSIDERDERVSQSTATQLGSGNITVAVLESDGFCNTTAELFIDSPAEISYDPSNEIIDNVSCFGFDDGAISTISAASGGTPGTAGYMFEWTHETTGDNFIGESITGLTAGNYALVISDENDCLSSTITRNITEPELLAAVIDTDPNNTNDVKCAGDNDGKITVIATGGNDDLGPYTYEWTNNVSTEAVATDLESNITYEIIVSDANGCEATVERMITEPIDLNPYTVDFDPIQCFGEFTTIRLDPASFSGGNGGDFTYSVDGCPEKDVSEPSCQVRGGLLDITVFDSGGCAYDDVIEVDEPDQIVIEFPTAEMDGTNFVVEVQLGGQIELNAEIFSDFDVPIAEVMWTDTSVICPPLGDCRNGIVNPLNDTPYTIEVVDQNGCEESATILVEVDKNRNVFIPNAFAPNSRGFDLNESFKVYTGLGVQSINFARVFNRWGTMVADIGQINDPSPSGIPVWNGQLEGQKLAQGVYVYIVSVTFVDNTTLLYRGDITLLR